MSRQSAFLVLLLVSSLYAFARGGRPERTAAGTLLGGAILSVAVARHAPQPFLHVEYGILAVDVAILGVFLWLSLLRTRNWPIPMSCLIAAEITLHVTRIIILPRPLPILYLHAVALWSWPAQTILIVATFRYRRRLQHEPACGLTTIS